MPDTKTARPRPARPAPPAEARSFIELIALQWQRERSDLDLDDFLLAIYFMRLGTLVDRAFGRMCMKLYGISGADMRVMLALRRGGPPYVKRPTDLFRALLVTSGAMTKKVDRLAALGMVERLPDPGNSGGFLVHLTRKGLQTVEHAVEKLALESVIGPALEQFSAAERAAGTEFCLRTLAAMEVSASAPGDDDEAPPPAVSGRRPRAAGRSARRAPAR